jgi:hypothetical protein
MSPPGQPPSNWIPTFRAESRNWLLQPPDTLDTPPHTQLPVPPSPSLASTPRTCSRGASSQASRAASQASALYLELVDRIKPWRRAAEGNGVDYIDGRGSSSTHLRYTVLDGEQTYQVEGEIEEQLSEDGSLSVDLGPNFLLDSQSTFSSGQFLEFVERQQSNNRDDEQDTDTRLN